MGRFNSRFSLANKPGGERGTHARMDNETGSDIVASICKPSASRRSPLSLEHRPHQCHLETSKSMFAADQRRCGLKSTEGNTCR